MPEPFLVLLRHGSAAAEWTVRGDPDLDFRGRHQARLVSVGLARLGPMKVLTSPLRRAQQTASPIGGRWERRVEIEPLIGEIEQPKGSDKTEASQWLAELAQLKWDELSVAHQGWRRDLLAFARSLREPTLFVTHMVAINLLLGYADKTDETITFWPANCSVSIIRLGDEWTVERIGRQRPKGERHFG